MWRGTTVASVALARRRLMAFSNLHAGAIRLYERLGFDGSRHGLLCLFGVFGLRPLSPGGARNVIAHSLVVFQGPVLTQRRRRTKKNRLHKASIFPTNRDHECRATIMSTVVYSGFGWVWVERRAMQGCEGSWQGSDPRADRQAYDKKKPQ